jgi:inositol-hexakisphosphate kinase
MVYLLSYCGMESCESEKYQQNTKIKAIRTQDSLKNASATVTTVSSTTTNTSKSITSLNEFLKPHSILSHSQSSDDDETEISYLSNQVGGHTRLLLLNDKTVIKPLNSRELEFYQNIPQEIQQFVPKYKGKFSFEKLLHRSKN